MGSVSLIRNRPITESLIEWFRPGWVHHHIANHARTKNNAHAYRRTHMRLTLVVAVAHTLHLTAATIVIFTLPVDIAKGGGPGRGGFESPGRNREHCRVELFPIRHNLTNPL
jgi:hypothetical protein